MLDCLILGDSIATGVHRNHLNCALYAEVGINSAQWNKRFRMMQLDAKTVVISLGSNDYAGIDTEAELSKLRGRVKAKQVIWILPAGTAKTSGVSAAGIRAIVNRISRKYGDATVAIPEVARDGVHPTNRAYNQISKNID